MIRRPARGFDSRWARRWRDDGTDTVSAQEYFDYYAGWARIYEAGEIISSDVSVRAEINISQHPRVDPYAIDATSARWRDGVGPRFLDLAPAAVSSSTRLIAHRSR